MKAIAAPMVGGLFTSFLLELLIYPPVYFLWRRRSLVQQPENVAGIETSVAEIYLPSEKDLSSFKKKKRKKEK